MPTALIKIYAIASRERTSTLRLPKDTLLILYIYHLQWNAIQGLYKEKE